MQLALTFMLNAPLMRQYENTLGVWNKKKDKGWGEGCNA